MQTSGGKGFIFNFPSGKMLRNSSQAVVVRNNTDCREITAVAAMVEYQQAAEPKQWSLSEGSGFLFPSVLEGGGKGDVALTAAQMITNRQTHLRAAGMGDKRYTMHSFREGGAASHYMDVTAMGALMEYVGGKSATVARKYVGVTASAATAGVKRCRGTAFIEADTLPLSGHFARSTQLSDGVTEAELIKGQGRSLGRIRTITKPAENNKRRQMNDGLETTQTKQKGWE